MASDQLTLDFPTPVDQDEINSILWRACDTFRGTVDPSEYKNYILVMLFVKYISDVWADHYAQYQQQFGDDDERIRRRLSRERFVLPENCDYYALYGQRHAPNIGEIINKALEKIEDANRVKLQGVFRNIDFNSESNLGRTEQRNERLKHLLEDFNDRRLDLRPSRVGNLDIIGDAYEYLIGKFASGAGKKAGEFYTPPAVSELLAELLDPQPGESICDPACGSGSLLIKCVRKVGSDNYAVYGQENNGSTWALAMMNMFLHDINAPRIVWGDTLRRPQLVDDDRLLTFNVVVANPPFSLDKWGAENAASDRWKRFERGVPPKSKGDYAFISHMVSTMDRVNGRMGVIVPHGVLFRGASEGAIRKALIEQNLLDAVIGLPPNLFYGTGIAAAILLFRYGRATDNVLFIDASRQFQEATNQNRLRDTDVQAIVQTYRRREPVGKYATLVTYDQIVANDYNLNLPRYVDTFEAEVDIDVAAANRQIKATQPQLDQLEAQMQAYLRELGLDE